MVGYIPRMNRSADERREHRRRTRRSELAGLAGPALLAREPDERLVALVRDGDQNAFAAIVKRYESVLTVHCRRTLPPPRAEDAVQQTFASAYVALMRGATPAALRPWLYAIAHNTSLNGLRERQPERLEVERELGDQHLPHEIVARRESLQGVVRAIGDLPVRQREVIVRQEFHGATHEQIAGELGVTTAAVRQLAHRARSAIRAAVGGLMPPPLWQRLQWLLAPSEGGALTGGSAGGVGLVAGKCVVAVLVAATAGGAVQLTSEHAIAGASPAAHASPARNAVATPPAAGAGHRTTGSDVLAILPTRTRRGAPAAPGKAGDAAPADDPARAERPADQGTSSGAAGPSSDRPPIEGDTADAQPSEEPSAPPDAAGTPSDGEPPSPAEPDTEPPPAPEADAPAEPDAGAAPGNDGQDASEPTSPADADTEPGPAA